MIEMLKKLNVEKRSTHTRLGTIEHQRTLHKVEEDTSVTCKPIGDGCNSRGCHDRQDKSTNPRRKGQKENTSLEKLLPRTADNIANATISS